MVYNILSAHTLCVTHMFCLAVLAKFAATLHAPYATTVSGGPMSVNMMQHQNVVGLISALGPAKDHAKKDQLMDQPRHHHRKGNAQLQVSQVIAMVLPELG